MADCDID